MKLTIQPQPNLDDWATALQKAIRDASVPPQLTNYFKETEVKIIGAGGASDPKRFMITRASGEVAPFVFGGPDVAKYGLEPPFSMAKSGIKSGELSNPPTGATSIEISLAPWLDIPQTAADGFDAWSSGLGAALRSAGLSPLVRPEHRAYLTGATVDLIGDGSTDNPRRFVIRAGKGAQPYDPGATLSFIGDSAKKYELAPRSLWGRSNICPLTGAARMELLLRPAGSMLFRRPRSMRVSKPLMAWIWSTSSPYRMRRGLKKTTPGLCIPMRSTTPKAGAP